MMSSEKLSSLIVLLLSISFVLGDPLHKSAFTKEIRLQKTTEPFKVNDKLIFNDGYNLTSAKPGAEELYTLSTVDVAIWPKSILNFGRGKLLFTSRYPGGFFVLNEHDFSNYKSNAIPYDQDVNANVELTSVVVYNDTFDVFDRRQEICMPCRYNDKGERLAVTYTFEIDSEDPLVYDQFSLELVKDGFGVKNGYFYVYRYINGTTAFRILDSRFHVVKQRLFPTKIEDYSLTRENLTVCEKIECHLLNADLKTIADVKLHQINDTDIAEVKVQNLADGGAMVAMLFVDGKSRASSVYIQRIRSDGQVDSPIRYSSEDEDLVHMDAFTFENGEYCLVTVNDRESENPYTLVRCLKP